MNRLGLARYSLKEVFEMRSLETIGGRRCTCRLFVRKGQWGAYDFSGALWPIVFSDSCQTVDLLDQGDMVELGFVRPFESAFACVAQFEMITRCAARRSDRSVLAQDQADNSYWKKFIEWLEDLDDRGCFDEIEAQLGQENLVNKKITKTRFIESMPFQQLKTHQRYQKIKGAVARFFRGEGYLELEAPLLVKSGGIEMYLNPFRTKYTDHQGREHELQLPTSPEFALKKLLTQGYPKVFSLAQTFRNGGEFSRWHRPQFCMLEWYTLGQNLDELIAQTFEVVKLVGDSLFDNDLAGTPRPREQFFEVAPLHLRIEDLYAQYFELDLSACMHDEQRFYRELKSKSVSVLPTDSFDTLFWKSFLDVIEPNVLQNKCVILSGFPHRFAALAAPEKNGLYAERFELFINGVEICNGYYELTDFTEMTQRFNKICSQRPEVARDRDFDDAMEFGMPAASGNALGLERLISVLQNQSELTTGHGVGAPF